MYGSPNILWKVEILLWTIQIYYESSGFSFEKSSCIMNYQDFIMKKGQDFHDDRSRFSWWQVELFMMAGRDFYDMSRFLSWQLEIFMMVPGQDFSWRQLDIFMMTGKDFYDSRLRFSCWQVDIFMMAGRNFYNEKSKRLWGQVEIFMMTGWDFSFRS